MTRTNLSFRKGLSKVEGAGSLDQCFQCSACVPDCPAAAHSSRFNPRDIVMRALLGLEEALVCADSLVWDCTTCYTCAERCPQGVKPIEVVTAVKNKIAEAGLLPRDVKGAVENIRNTGRVIRHTDAVDRHRQELSLPPLGGSVKFIEEVLER